MADLQHKCDEGALTWWWEGVPSDDSGPGKDSYYVAVHNNETGELLYEAPGAEDNAHGEPYTVMVPMDTEIYLIVMNEAESFSFEHDAVVTCHSTQISASPIVELPYTGVADYLLPVAIVLTALGAGIVRLAKA